MVDASMQRIKAQSPLRKVVEPYFQAELQSQMQQVWAELQEVRAEQLHELQSQVLLLAGKRFAPFPDEARQRISTASAATLRKWFEQLLDASSLEEVFGAEQDNEGENEVGDAGSRVTHSSPQPYSATAIADTAVALGPMARAVLRVAQKRFGPVSGEVRQLIVTASDATLEDWLEQLIDAQTVDEVFGTGEAQVVAGPSAAEIAESKTGA